jgi:hypothetical protein
LKKKSKTFILDFEANSAASFNGTFFGFYSTVRYYSIEEEEGRSMGKNLFVSYVLLTKPNTL